VATYRGFTINEQGDPAPWGTTENSLFKSILDFLPQSSDSSIINNEEHKHYKLYDTGGSLAVSVNATGNVTVSGMTVAGFVKNDASGVLSGGNSIAVGDLPAHATTHESGGVDTVDHDNLVNFVGNKHIDHTSVSLTAGDGLTGGGDISSSRSFAVGAGTGITVNANDIAIKNAGSLTDGRITYWDDENGQLADTEAYWDSVNSRFGIGTDAPNYFIDAQTSGVARLLQLKRTDAGSVYQLFTDSSGDYWLIGHESGNNFILNYNGSEKVVWTSDGDFGLGGNPNRRVEITDSSTVYVRLTNTDTTVEADQVISAIESYSSDASTNCADVWNKIEFAAAGDHTANDHKTKTSFYNSDATNLRESMRIDQADESLSLYCSNTEQIGIEWRNMSYDKFSAGIRLIDGGGTWAKWGLGFYTGDDDDNSTDASLRMSIMRDGKVIIGDTSSSYKFKVQDSSDSTNLLANFENPNTGTSAAGEIRVNAEGNHAFIRAYGDSHSTDAYNVDFGAADVGPFSAVSIVSGGIRRITAYRSGNIVINEDGEDTNLRIEGSGNANLLFCDGGNDRVGIKTNSPLAELDVNGSRVVRYGGYDYFLKNGASALAENGNWRTYVDASDDLVTETRIGGSWTTIQTLSAS
jgi:hypothetical protein